MMSQLQYWVFSASLDRHRWCSMTVVKLALLPLLPHHRHPTHNVQMWSLMMRSPCCGAGADGGRVTLVVEAHGDFSQAVKLDNIVLRLLEG